MRLTLPNLPCRASRRGIIISAISLCCLLLGIGCSNKDDIVRSNLFKTIHVPANAATIQAAIDKADGGDTILVADGIYSGPGNRDLEITNKILVILSENGPENTIINCGGSVDSHHGGITYEQVGHKGSVFQGFTIRNGYRNEGAAMLFSSSSPQVSNCILAGNHATVSGGAIKFKASSATITNCTIINNTCNNGAATFGLAGSTPDFVNCLIAFNDSSEVMIVNESTTKYRLVCCDVYGNEMGDFVGDISSMASGADNFSADPQLCELEFDFSLQSSSPCTPANSSCGELVGALGVGCQAPPK